MKKSKGCREIVRLNSAVFKVPSRNTDVAFESFLEAVLGKVLGGDSEALAGCTEFTCNLYAPAPPLRA